MRSALYGVLILATACGTASAAPRDDWLKAIIQVQAATKAGISQRQFAELYSNANTALEIAKSSGGMNKDAVTRGDLLIGKMEVVNLAWQACLADGFQRANGFVFVGAPLGKLLTDTNENLQKSLSQPPTAPEPLAASNGVTDCRLVASQFLSHLAKEAQKARAAAERSK